MNEEIYEKIMENKNGMINSLTNDRKQNEIKTRGENMKTSQIITENKSAANYLTLKSKLKKHKEYKKRENRKEVLK